MPKKQQKKAPVYAKTAVSIKKREGEIKILEAYPTAKKRLLDSLDFIEVTRDDKRKLIISKDAVEGIKPLD